MKIRNHTLGTSWLLSAAIVAGSALSHTAAADAPAANVTAKRLVKAADEPSQWMTYGGTYSEQRFSTLKQIDAGNVGTLGLQWYGDYETNQDQHGSPLYIDGAIYVSTSRDVVQAFDAKTGKPLLIIFFAAEPVMRYSISAGHPDSQLSAETQMPGQLMTGTV